jgi:short-subunit dehydrogenase
MAHPIAPPAAGCAWITGASSGIGREVALALARAGWTVALSARSADKLDALAEEIAGKGGKAVAVPCDVTDAEAVAAAVDRIEGEAGEIALAFLNAGIYEPDRVEELDAAAFAKTVNVNLIGTVTCLAALKDRWIERGRGHAAIVSSVAGYRGLPRSLSYGSTKAALTNFAEALKFDFDRLGLKVQVIHPGFVRTPATEVNDFKMPALMEPEDAAQRIVEGLAGDRFEITFPKRFTYVLKALRLLPYAVYFWLLKRQTGAR